MPCYRVNQPVMEFACPTCGAPVTVGDLAYQEHDGGCYCSAQCCIKAVRLDPPLTTVLPCGFRVLALLYEGEPSGKTYANAAQAEKAAEKTRAAGWPCWVWHPRMGRVRYVVLGEQPS